MIKIRLSRGGAKNDPHYRIIAIEKTRKRDGKPLGIIGHWYPKKDSLKIDKDKYLEWIKNGAKPSAAVAELFMKLK